MLAGAEAPRLNQMWAGVTPADMLKSCRCGNTRCSRRAALPLAREGDSQVSVRSVSQTRCPLVLTLMPRSFWRERRSW